MVKLTNEDKKFLLELSLKNRDFLTTLASINITMAFSFTAFVFTILTILLSLNLLNEYKPYLTIVFLIIGGINFVKGMGESVKNFRSATKLNEQYQKFLKEVYPNLDLKKFYH